MNCVPQLSFVQRLCGHLEARTNVYWTVPAGPGDSEPTMTKRWMLAFTVVTVLTSVQTSQAGPALGKRTTSIQLAPPDHIGERSPECDEKTFSVLVERVKNATEQLAAATARAESELGIACTYENITLKVARLFLVYAQYDFNNAGRWRVLEDDDTVEVGNDSLLACRELNKTLDILANARAQLEKLVAGKGLHRRAIPQHKTLGSSIKDGFVISAEGVPIFPGGYDQGIWRWHYGFSTEAVFRGGPRAWSRFYRSGS